MIPFLKRFISFGLPPVVLLMACVAAPAQFNVTKPAPYSAAVARQKIHTLIANANEDNRDQSLTTISNLLTWYRDIVDDELIARWKSDGRANVPLLLTPLTDARVAREVVAFSWRVDPADTFVLQYAPMLGDLMARYPESAKPFLDDLLATPPAVRLSEPAAQAACRILLDMPEIGTWKKSALQILPAYRSTVDQLLKQDIAGTDQEKNYRALRWRSELRLDPPPQVSSGKLIPRPGRTVVASNHPVPDSYAQRPHIVGQQPGVPAAYSGPMSGTFQSNGDPIPPNGECVFPNIPPVHLLLDYDTKHWEARLTEGQPQSLVLRNKGRNTQKRCVVHWSVVE